MFLDRVINLIEEGVDLAFRIGELPDSSLTAAAVGRVSQVLCASPDYLAEHGEPRHPDELARHELVATSGGVSPTREWRFQHRGEALAVGIAPRITVTSNDAALTAARLGWGITRLLSYQIAAPVRAGQLKLLLADYTPPPLPVHVVSLEGRRASAKVRGFADFAVARLRADASIN